MMRKIIASFLLITCTLLFTSCATTRRCGNGIVVAEEQQNARDFKPNHRTITGATSGGSIGAVCGGVLGGAVGLLGGCLTGTPTGVALGTVAGGVVGGFLFGVAGATLGGGAGYVGDVVFQDATIYQYKVKVPNKSELLTITQHAGPIPLNSHVRILEKSGTVFIRKN